MQKVFLVSYLQTLKSLGLERGTPNISEQNAVFLKNLIREKDPKNLLEIGTANGYSTLQFASVIPEGSSITTIEFAWNAHIEAVEHFKNCKIKNIYAIWGDAKEVIPTLKDRHFDFIFIDAMKREYLRYLQEVLPKCTPDALIVIDDVEKFRDKMENLYAWLDKNNIPYKLEKTDEDDSVMLIERKNIPLGE